MQYLGNIHITVWFFVFWCWTFVIRFFIHNFSYYTALFFSTFDDEYLIILRIKNRQTLICYCNTFFCWIFFKRVRLNIIMLIFIKYFHSIVPYCKIKSNIFFLLLNIDKSLEQRTDFSTFLFATGTWIKQPVYICILDIRLASIFVLAT